MAVRRGSTARRSPIASSTRIDVHCFGGSRCTSASISGSTLQYPIDSSSRRRFVRSWTESVAIRPMSSLMRPAVSESGSRKKTPPCDGAEGSSPAPAIGAVAASTRRSAAERLIERIVAGLGPVSIHPGDPVAPRVVRGGGGHAERLAAGGVEIARLLVGRDEVLEPRRVVQPVDDAPRLLHLGERQLVQRHLAEAREVLLVAARDELLHLRAPAVLAARLRLLVGVGRGAARVVGRAREV